MSEWQDWVIAAGQACFFVAQVGMIRRHARVPLLSASLTAFWLWAFVPAFATWGAWAATVSSLAGAVSWTILAWRNRHYREEQCLLIKTLQDIVSYPTDSEVTHALQCAARDALEEYAIRGPK